ncbi:immunoglobulin I-set domain protein [Necator americanus]|uniref:Immunoglobulin I-set domain protein n=1 Tax=Necator americanus TaxID=51031 RepID=W2T9P1_NECAM|nr:immunoglobulin I-set domain protein [Necator americanus]ETN78588.1 immunoglobulin I-set domain protein [Necator americanus]
MVDVRESQADDIPSSGLVIPEERRRELLGDESEDEITESISELPSFSGAKTRKRPSEVRVRFSELVQPKMCLDAGVVVCVIREEFQKLGRPPSSAPAEPRPSRVFFVFVVPNSFMSLTLRMSSQKVLIGSAKQARPSPIRRQIKDDMSQDSLMTSSRSLDKSDSMSSIPSIDMDKEPQGQTEVKKVSKTKKTSTKVNKVNGKTATATVETSSKDSATVVKKKLKSTVDSRADTSDDASSLRSRLKPVKKKEESRRSSIDMRRESVQEIMERVCTPLVAKGQKGKPPKIVEVPENVTVVENETAVLQCKIEGDPVPTVRWAKGNREILNGGRFRHMTDGETNTVSLALLKCRSQDDGPYTLTIENKHGSDTIDIKLLVTSDNGLDFRAMLKHREYEPSGQKEEESQKPMTEAERRQSLFPGKKVEKWEHPLEDKTVQQQVDKFAEWKCTYSRPNAKIRWYKDRKEIFSGEPRHTFVVPMKSQKVNENDVATLETDVNDRDADVEWWHDGVKINVDGKKYKEERVSRKRRLIITCAKIEDHGEYKCTTKDDKTMAQLIVDALNKFIIKLKDLEVVEKEDVVMTCQTKDTKTPGIWNRNGIKITSMPGGKFETQSRNGTHTLKISKIEMNEGENYEIDVAGLIGSCVVTVLEAEKRPVLNWKPKKIEAKAGEPCVVKVPFQIKGTRRGDPKPVILRNGKPIDESMKDLVEVVINGDVVEIKFKNPQLADTGKWALELGNSAGTALAPFELFVKDKPKPPKGPLEVKNVTAEGLELKWGQPDSDEGQPVKAYIVEVQEGRSGNWKKIAETKGTDFKVKDLKENGEYKFRVKAVNDVGVSDPLTGDTVIAKNPYKAPGKPRNMDVADMSKDQLTLQWDPPEDDGQSPIIEYVVERREKSEKDWRTVGTTPAEGLGTHYLTDDKVVEGTEYYYRVRAVNKAGPGDPCDHGNAVKIKAKPVAPEFPGGGIKDLRLKVGETIKYDVAITGEPVPEVSWVVDGKPLKPVGRVKMSTERGKTKLKIENAERSDSGQFTIILKNASGIADSTAKVTVVGRPTPPKGPLDISDIHTDGATLAWNPPEDDGGDPLTGYIIEAQDMDNKGKYIEVARVDGKTTEAKVKGLRNKGNYKFRYEHN